MNPLKVGLAIALSTVGVGSGVAFGVANLAPVNEVQQAQAGATVKRYLDCSSFAEYDNAESIAFHTWGNGDKYIQATKAADNYWFVNVDLSGVTGYQWLRCASSGPNSDSSRYNWQNNAPNTNANYYKVTGWNNSGNWSTVATDWYIVGSTTGDSGWNGGNEDISFPLEERFNNEGLQFYNTNVQLSAGSAFKIKNSSGTYYGYNAIETGAGSVIATGDVSGSGTSNIAVVNSGSYEVYMKPFAGKFWMQENSEATATAWATSFLSATSTICSTGGTAADHSSALSGIWGDQKTSFDNLTLGARNLIIAGTANATIKDAHDRYVHIMERYSDSLDSFEDWDVNGARQMSLLSKDNGAIIAIISVVSVLSLTSLALFVLKKKKHQ